MRRILFTLTILVISLSAYAVTLRGNIGNPDPQKIEYALNKSGKPFETSQERSRWAMILSLVNERRFEIDSYASMGTPDIGRIKGHYYSFFPPALSLFAIPLYLLGLRLNASQLFVFATPAFFALGTMFLMGKFLARRGYHWSLVALAPLAFGFATSAWGYSVTLFAHLVSAFFLMSGIYLATRNEKPTFGESVGIWLSYSLAIFTDFPNAFIFLPIAIYHFLHCFDVTEHVKNFSISIKFRYIIGLATLFICLGLYGYYNYVHFGNPTTLSNTIPRVQDLKIAELAVAEKTKNAGQSLNTRNIINGIYTFIFSPDRSLAVYAPTVLLFLFGLFAMRKQYKKEYLLLLAVPATCFTLYTMFGDPYGGWAFGSRYMVAIMPELVLLAIIGLAYFSRSILVRLLYSVVILWSMCMALMAALTTNVIPPYVEARYLGIDYTGWINVHMLQKSELNSFVYNTLAYSHMSGIQYFMSIAIPLGILFLVLIWIKKPYETEHI